MEDKIIELLTDLVDGEIYRQGSVNTYPDLFITFWKNESRDGNHYDNNNSSIIYNYDINVYGKNTQKVYDTMSQTIAILKANKFIISGDSNDIASDDNNFMGLGVNAKYFKREV